MRGFQQAGKLSSIDEGDILPLTPLDDDDFAIVADAVQERRELVTEASCKLFRLPYCYRTGFLYVMCLCLLTALTAD